MNELLSRGARHFLDLGFYPGQIELGSAVARKRLMWSLVAYLLLFLGLLSRQCINVGKATPFEFSPDNLRWKVLAASAVVALSLFQPFTHWFNRKRPEPSWEHVLWAFSFGFFVNLSSSVILK